MAGRVGDQMSELALETLLEATLFGSGKSMSVKDLSEALGYEEDEVIKIAGNLIGGTAVDDDITFPVLTISNTSAPFARMDIIAQDFITRTDGKSFLSIDANGAETAWKINFTKSSEARFHKVHAE